MKTLLSIIGIVIILTVMSCKVEPTNLSYTFTAEDFVGYWNHETYDRTIRINSVTQLEYIDTNWRIHSLVISDDGLSFTARKKTVHSTGVYYNESHFEGILIASDTLILTQTYSFYSKPDGTSTTNFTRFDEVYLK
ncbi:hypothetical protein LCGC14_1843490 [marine sediment metagenome]|uniref:Uncharacterized protein n=1 Tax=marine sediment metagenome TaxID=412755 RepID=A0A0F9GCM8_9ZZZZ